VARDDQEQDEEADADGMDGHGAGCRAAGEAG
jgi:hypothetical protein